MKQENMYFNTTGNTESHDTTYVHTLYDSLNYKILNEINTIYNSMKNLSFRDIALYGNIFLILYMIAISYTITQKMSMTKSVNKRIKYLEDEIENNMLFTRHVVLQCDNYITKLENKIEKVSKRLNKFRRKKIRRSKRLISKSDIDYENFNNTGVKRRKLNDEHYVSC